MKQIYKRYLNLIVSRRLKRIKCDNDSSVAGIIFSKDRCIQLHALLESYYHFTENTAPLYVLWAARNKEHSDAYKELQTLWPHVNFIKEHDFNVDLSTLINNLSSSKVFFLVDDILFVRRYNLADFTVVDCKKYIPSLRLGANITYSYTQNQAIKTPEFMPLSSNTLQWKWTKKNGYWSYPLSLDGHFFNRAEIKELLTQIRYSAPNTLEVALNNVAPLFRQRSGVCFITSVLINCPWNMVQNEIDNKHEEIEPDFLLEQWNKGKKIDFLKYQENTYTSCHVNCTLSLSSR